MSAQVHPNGSWNRIEEKAGTRYGELVVLEYSGKTKYGSATWKCRCDCGNESVVRGDNLRLGHTISCGCLYREGKRKLPFGVASFNKALNSMRGQARKRGYEWKLSKEQARKLMGSPCHYCGVGPSNTMRTESNNGDCKYSGIDRLNNEEGYVLGNVVSCCLTCNKAKGTATYDNFKKWIQRLIIFNGNGRGGV